MPTGNCLRPTHRNMSAAPNERIGCLHTTPTAANSSSRRLRCIAWVNLGYPPVVNRQLAQDPLIPFTILTTPIIVVTFHPISWHKAYLKDGSAPVTSLVPLFPLLPVFFFLHDPRSFSFLSLIRLLGPGVFLETTQYTYTIGYHTKENIQDAPFFHIVPVHPRPRLVRGGLAGCYASE
ncbi:hypothetical protein B0H12DRAFT_1101914 [Mycena haematopus]|nr:hypothetical protein B0H12DRAFT_1101914 [Mycena haematopus]